MNRILLTLIVGVALGAGTAYLLVQGGATNKPLLVRPEPIRDVPKMSVEDATAHRDDSYVEIKTIEDTLALPTDFAQTEALYVLAGRSDSRQVQDLIYQASLIADPSDRRGGLQILFSRLAELDPRSALALAQTRDYAADRQLEATVWARSLPAGAQRDAAIAGLASGWQALTPSRKLLLAGIGDLERRRQAQVSVLYQLARSDPDAVERLMLEFDLPDQYRQPVESMTRQWQTPGVSFSRERY